jgi:hypothetical protein
MHALVVYETTHGNTERIAHAIGEAIGPFGYAAPRIAQSLERSGGHLLAPPAGFVVEGIKGPIREGELERAAAWAKGLIG